jgi:hypothetical protein
MRGTSFFVFGLPAVGDDTLPVITGLVPAIPMRCGAALFQSRSPAKAGDDVVEWSSNSKRKSPASMRGLEGETLLRVR